MSTHDDTFGRQSQALGRALQDLLADVPDATDSERSAHVTRITDRLTEDWHGEVPPPAESPVQAAYNAFLTHLRGCPDWCNSANGRCPDGRKLWGAYMRARHAASS